MPNTVDCFTVSSLGVDPLLTIGVVADTHVPDRVRSLPAGLLPGLRAAGVSVILHAGDITTQSVLDDLAQIAPVIAVMGNRDFLIRPVLPLTRTLEYAGVSVGLAHGHGGWVPYMRGKVQQAFLGYRFERFRRRLLPLFPGARVIVFGHTHIPELRWENEVLFFNPGGACTCPQNDFHPRFGLLRFYEGGKVEGEIISLPEDSGN
jgi:putative phosphoesterase